MFTFFEMCQGGERMYTGTNPKALLTMQLITEAFKQLLTKKKYENINVKSICQKADVSRQAFYNVFESKEEVLRECINDIFRFILDKHANDTKISAENAIEYFVQIFYENKEFVECVIDNRLERVLAEQFVHAISKLSRMYYKGEIEHLDYMMEFYAGGLTQLLAYWMYDTNRVSPEELIEILDEEIKMPYF